jgi:hypothetical protein
LASTRAGADGDNEADVALIFRHKSELTLPKLQLGDWHLLK